MTSLQVPDRAEAIRDRYRATFGAVPGAIEQRLQVAGTTGRLSAVEVIEDVRQVLLTDNVLGSRVQQLVHFGQLLVLGHSGPARLHARGALRAGATLTDLVGVAETAMITAGMPAYSLGIEIIAELIGEAAGAHDPLTEPTEQS